MHPCLLSPEIFAHILIFVNLEKPNPDIFRGYHEAPDYNPTLARLARTCKTFLEPVLDVLWYSQRTLAPLVRTLPERIWEEEVRGYEQATKKPMYTLELINLPAASEWSRFDYYANRIKELGFLRYSFADANTTSWFLAGGEARRREVTLGVIRCLSLTRRRRWLLPNLISLRWNNFDSPYISLLPLFLGPKLVRFSISYTPLAEEFNEGYTSVEASQLFPILDLCPSLTQLEIYPQYPDAVVSAAVRFALRCPHLEAFAVSSREAWSADLLRHLASQPFLREVKLRLDDSTSDVRFLNEAVLHYPFPSLQKLVLDGPSLSSAIDLIRIMQSCRLHTIALNLTDKIVPAALAELFETLQCHCSHDTLQVVEITWVTEARRCTLGGGDTFALVHLRPLLDFRHMRTLVFLIPMNYDLGNSDIRLIADSWPLLIKLRLGHNWGFSIISELTWSGIAYLLSRCPQMIDLSISFDSTVDDAALTTSLPDFRPNRHLRFLDVLDSVIRDVEIFAHSLFAIAPLVAVLSGWGYESAELEISPPLEASAFISQVDNVIWELRRTRMREEFGFLDRYVMNEADQMNPFAPSVPQFPYGRTANMLVCNVEFPEP